MSTAPLTVRLRKCAQRISDSVSEKDSEWEEIGLMREAADDINRLRAALRFYASATPGDFANDNGFNANAALTE